MQPILYPGPPSALSATSKAPKYTTRPLLYGDLSPTQRAGLLDAVRADYPDHVTTPIQDVVRMFNLVTDSKASVELMGGFQTTLCGALPSARSCLEGAAPPDSVGSPVIGVDRPLVHALFTQSYKALQTPYLAEVVCLLVPADARDQLLCLAQFHEVRVAISLVFARE